MYEVADDWAHLPTNRSFVEVAGIAIDHKDRVYVFNRSYHPMMIFDREGEFLMSWGEGVFSAPHHVRIGPDRMVYCVDFGDHTVRRISPEGEVLLAFGTKGCASDTGAVGRDFGTIRRSSGPFNQPTDIAFGPSGEIYVSDGYGNARVHKFSYDGELLNSWGHPGDGPGQFNLPHSLWVDKQDRLYVADRENSRIQIFSLDGEYITEWSDVNRPTCICTDGGGARFLVTELGYLAGMFHGRIAPVDRKPYARVTIRSREGEVLSQWGEEDGCATGHFFAPHTICVDSRGDIYVGEVTFATGAPRSCHALQKFVKMT